MKRSPLQCLAITATRTSGDTRREPHGAREELAAPGAPAAASGGSRCGARFHVRSTASKSRRGSYTASRARMSRIGRGVVLRRRRSPSRRRKCRRRPRAISAMLSAFTPPSTSSQMSRPSSVDAPAHLGDLRQHRARMNCWPPKPGLTDISSTRSSLSSVWSRHVERRRRVEHQPGLAALLLDQRDGAIDVLGGLRVEADDARARLGELRNDAVHRLDHQVHVDRHAHVRACSAAHTSGPTVRFGT